MYTSHELCENIILKLENDYHLFLKNLPKSLFFLEAAFDDKTDNQNDINMGILKIINLCSLYKIFCNFWATW